MEDVKYRTKSSWFDLSNINIKNQKGKPLKAKTKTELLKICLENHKEYGLDSYDFCNNFVSILKKYVYDEDKKVYTEYPLADEGFCDAVFGMLEKTDKPIVKQYAFSIFMSIFLPYFHAYINLNRRDIFGSYGIIDCLTAAIVSASHNFCDLRISSDFMKRLCEYTKDCKYIITLGKEIDTENSFYCHPDTSCHGTRQLEAITAIISCYMSMLLSETDKLFSGSDSQKAQRWCDTFFAAVKNFFDVKIKKLDTRNEDELNIFESVFKEFLIELPVKLKKEYGLITYRDIKNLTNVIDQYFSSNRNTRSEMILCLFRRIDFFKDFARIQTCNRTYYKYFLSDLCHEAYPTKNDQIDKIKNLYLKLLSYTNDSQLLKKNDKEKAQFYFDRFMVDIKNFFNDELKKHELDEQGNIPSDFQVSLKFAISVAMDIKINADLAITYDDVFMFADIIYKYFPSNKDIQSKMILYLFEQFDIIKDTYGIDFFDESGEFSFRKLWASLDGAKVEVAWAAIQMCSKGRKGLTSLSSGDWLSFDNLSPKVLSKQVENYNSKNKVSKDKQFNLKNQVFGATDGIWKKLGHILRFSITKDMENNDSKSLNLSAVFKFLCDKGFNIYDYIVKFEKLYSHVSDALLKGLVNKLELENNILKNECDKQMYTKIIRSLTVGLFKSLSDEENISIIVKTKSRKDNDENKNIANEINGINEINIISDENKYKQETSNDIVDKLSNDIVDVFLKKFGSLYGFICKFKEAVVPCGDGSKILSILNFVIDVIFDKDTGSGKSIASILIASLNQIDWWQVISELTNVKKTEISAWFSLFFLMLITCTKFLDCETSIYQKKGSLPQLTVTKKLINNLKQIMSDKNFIELANDFGIDKDNLSKIESFLDNIANLKVEDCSCILYLAYKASKLDKSLDLVFDLAQKFCKEYKQPTVQITSDTKKNKIITRDKNVFDIMNTSDEVKKVDDGLKKSADIQLKTFIWIFKSRLQFLFEKTNIMIDPCQKNPNDLAVKDLLSCSYMLSNLLEFVYDDLFGAAIIKEISSTDGSKNNKKKKDEPSSTEKWISVFTNFNKIFGKYKILNDNSIFFDMKIRDPENSTDIVNRKYGIHIHFKNIFDILVDFSKQKIKLYPEKNKQYDTIFIQFKDNLRQFNKRMTKAVNNEKKTWEKLGFVPWEKRYTNFDALFYIAQNYKLFDDLCTKIVNTESFENNGKIISMEPKDLFNYFQKLWTWLDFTFGAYYLYKFLNSCKHNDESCSYCNKFDNILSVINYVYENRTNLKKSDSDDSLLVALLSVEKLLDKVYVHKNKENTLKDLKKRFSDVIYYFRYLKDREIKIDEKESLKSNAKKDQINEINDVENNNIDEYEISEIDKTKNEIKDENQNTISLPGKSTVQKSDSLLKIPKIDSSNGFYISKQKNINKNIKSNDKSNLNLKLDGDQINTSVKNNEQSEKQLDNNIVNGNNMIDVKNNKKCETNEINQKENENKNGIVIESQNLKNETVENKNNNHQQKNKLDSQSVETGLVVYKSNQFLENYDKEVCFEKTKNLILSTIARKKINMDNEIINNLFSKNIQAERIENKSEKDINNKNEDEEIKIEYDKEININIINNENEKQNGVGTDDIGDKNKIENNKNENEEIIDNNEIGNKSEKDINDKNENEEIKIEYDKEIDINIINNENEKQNNINIEYIDIKNKNEIEINNEEIDNNESNVEKGEPRLQNEIKSNTNEIHQSLDDIKLDNTNLKNKIKVTNSKEESKIENGNKIINNNLINNEIENKIEHIGNINNKESGDKNEKQELTLKRPQKNFGNGFYISKEIIKSDGKYDLNLKSSQKLNIESIADLKDQEPNQNPDQKNLCFIFIFVGIVFFIVAAIFLTNIIFTWFVMNFIAQLAIMIFSVGLGFICIFKNKSLWQKLSSWCTKKCQTQTIPKNDIDISYNQNKTIGGEKTNSDVFPKSKKTNCSCLIYFFWK